MSSFFKASEVNPDGDFVIPPNDYQAVITGHEFKQSKNNPSARYIQATVEVTDEGPAKGFKLRDIINIDNPNATAHRIAMQTISAICHATGRSDFEANSADELAAKFSEFYYKPMTVRVDTESQSGYADKSVIKKYAPPASGASTASPFGQPQSSGAPAASATTTSPSDGAKPFWADKAA